MSRLNDYLESGLLELYVMGLTSEEESREIELLAAASPEIRKEIAGISAAFESYAQAGAVEPHPAVKPMVLALADYMDRLSNGEAASFPPLLHAGSQPADFREWLERSDMIRPADAENLFARIIGYTPQATTAIVWIGEHTPFEVHGDEYERFLILEGSCDFKVGDKVHQLVAGDFLDIPLHTGHTATVTSAIPCKVILQRVAA